MAALVDGFSNEVLYRAMGGKHGKNMAPRGGLRAHGDKVFGFPGVAVCCSGASCESAKILRGASPASFESVVDGCPSVKGHSKKLKDLRDASTQDKVVVFSADGTPAKWGWHGFYKLEIIEIFADAISAEGPMARLAKVRFTALPHQSADVAALRAAVEAAVAAAAAEPKVPKSKPERAASTGEKRKAEPKAIQPRPAKKQTATVPKVPDVPK
ncbi:hypothetical protein M885DRAFT_518757 [Pelagophyceae sp. CCMP2097]|nr:hypothetical protein M885DRAFT_518757 [Pelagophyceae sp. CCMP2097]